MKNKETVVAEEVAQKILGILDTGADSKQWIKMVECIKKISTKAKAWDDIYVKLQMEHW
jgi:hypothetical protein